MRIIKETSTKLVITDFPSLCYVLMLAPYYLLLLSLLFLAGFSFVLANANSFFSAFILGVLCITPGLIALAGMLPSVSIFSFDKNLGYFQSRKWNPWKPYKIEKKEYLLKTIDRVETQTRIRHDGETTRVICLVLNEDTEKVDLCSCGLHPRKDEQQAEAVAEFLNVKNYGVIPLRR